MVEERETQALPQGEDEPHSYMGRATAHERVRVVRAEQRGKASGAPQVHLGISRFAVDICTAI
jgi:hypothetical protein